jgi:hypothetical protein
MRALFAAAILFTLTGCYVAPPGYYGGSYGRYYGGGYGSGWHHHHRDYDRW